jgi:hypothetical protein
VYHKADNVGWDQPEDILKNKLLNIIPYTNKNILKEVHTILRSLTSHTAPGKNICGNHLQILSLALYSPSPSFEDSRNIILFPFY